jgi:hypothetical protein
MLQSGEYADALRVVGRWLELQDARRVEVTDEGEFLSVSWEGSAAGGGQRQFRAFELAQLRREAQLLRTSPGGTPSAGLSEMLRTLGGELDRLSLELLSILELPDGFRMSTAAGGRHNSYQFSLQEVQQMSAAQRSQRAGRPAATPEVVGYASPGLPSPSSAITTPVRTPPQRAATPSTPGQGLRARIQSRNRF